MAEEHDSIVARMILLALGVPARKAKRIAALPMPQAPAAQAPAPALTRRRRKAE